MTLKTPAPDWPVTPLAPRDLVVRLRPPPDTLTPDLASEIDALWSEARARRPALFNGRIFSADRIETGTIEGHWSEYRLVLAQIMRPALFDRLRIRSLAVNGVLCTPAGIVFGRRDPHAVYQPGLWQTPPAGSVEQRGEDASIDLADQLLAELEEELGIPADAIDRTAITPLCTVEHPHSHVIDLGLAVRAPFAFDEIARHHAARGNREYHDLIEIPWADLPAQLAHWGDEVVPPAHAFIDAVRASRATRS